MAHLRKLHECDECTSSFYLTAIDTDRRGAAFCPYCGSESLQTDEDDEPQGLVED